ncbi:MAG: TIM barrel protein [Oscillospiraceae bacterium]|nr:TIM barrel protein [Oscillospiraceae bacterium]
MEYLISTISDVTTEEENGDWEKLSYADRTAPLAAGHGMGLELAEFCISDNMENSFADVLPHVEACAAAVKRKTLHAPYNELYPQAIDPMIVEVARRRYDLTWTYCLRFGAEKMIAHANYVEALYYPSWFVSRHVEFWRRFLEDHPEPVTVCLENVMETGPELMLDIVKRVDDPRLRLCLDVGHANLSDVAPEEWLKACAPWISHYHIHNNNGPVAGARRSQGDTHSALDQGVIDMEGLLRLAERLTPDATAAVESYEPERCVAWLKEKGFV